MQLNVADGAAVPPAEAAATALLTPDPPAKQNATGPASLPESGHQSGGSITSSAAASVVAHAASVRLWIINQHILRVQIAAMAYRSRSIASSAAACAVAQAALEHIQICHC